MLTIIIIAVLAFIIASIMIVIFARKASNMQQSPVQTKKASLSQEQSESLNNARSVLTNARMTLSRISDQEINKAGNRACEAIEKVLHTLKEKPEKIQTTRQLFNYYLPTLDKVVSRYQRIESSGTVEPGMPEKVRGYLDNVTEAMGNLYEWLFDNDKLNVEVDMEAMTIAIRRDGLLDDEDFKNLKAEVNSRPEEKKPAEAVPDETAAHKDESEEEGQPLEMPF